MEALVIGVALEHCVGTTSLALESALLLCCQLFGVGHTRHTLRHQRLRSSPLFSFWSFCKRLFVHQAAQPTSFHLVGVGVSRGHASYCNKHALYSQRLNTIKIAFLHMP